MEEIEQHLKKLNINDETKTIKEELHYNNKLNNETLYNDIDKDKQKIIDLFLKNIKGIDIILESNNHCGKEGYWLETKMGVKHNDKNNPDLYGYEMKKNSSKISFGDFSASEYLFSSKKSYIKEYNKWIDDIKITKNDYIKYFGTKNEKKNNRYSWSGSCVPTYNNWNHRGQNMIFNENNDLCIYYLFDKDQKTTKNELPYFLKTNKKIN